MHLLSRVSAAAHWLLLLLLWMMLLKLGVVALESLIHELLTCVFVLFLDLLREESARRQHSLFTAGATIVAMANSTAKVLLEAPHRS